MDRITVIIVAALLAPLALSSQVQAQRSGEVRGRVVDAVTGEGVPGASVYFTGVGTGLDGGAPNTGADGSFQSFPLTAGSYHLNAWVVEIYSDPSLFTLDTMWPDVWWDAYARGAAAAGVIEVAAGQVVEGIVVTLRHGGRVRLCLRGPGGEPIVTVAPGPDQTAFGGLPIVRSQQLGPQFYGWRMNATADQPGCYISAPLPPENSYSVMAYTFGTDFVGVYYPNHPWYSDAEFFADVTADAVVDKVMTLERGGTFSGTVRNLAGAGVAAVIQWHPVSMPPGEMSGGVFEIPWEQYIPDTGQYVLSGDYRSPGVAPGEYAIRADGRNLQPYFLEFFDNRPTFNTATRVSIAVGEDTPGVDFVTDDPLPTKYFVTDPISLTVFVQEGATASAAFYLSVTEGTASWTATTDAAWLSVSPAEGSVGELDPWRLITVTVDATAAAGGGKQGEAPHGTVQIVDPSGQTIALLLAVGAEVYAVPAAPAQPVLNRTSVELVSPLGDPPVAQSVELHNAGSEPFSWSVTGPAWATLSPREGTLAAEQTTAFFVSADPDYAAGSDRGTVLVKVGGLADIPVTVSRTSFVPHSVQAWLASSEPTLSIPVVATGLAGADDSYWSSDVFVMPVPGGKARPAQEAVAALQAGLRSPGTPAPLQQALRRKLQAVATAAAAEQGLGPVVPKSGPLTWGALGDDPTQSKASSMTFTDGRSRLLHDLLGDFFDVSSGSSMVQIRGQGVDRLIVWSRTFSTAPDGSTYGQLIPVPGVDDIIPVAGGEAVVPALVGGSAFRSNLIVTELTGTPAAVTVELHAPDGALTGAPLQHTVEGFGKWQVNNLFGATGAPVTSAYAVVRSAGGGQVSAMGSVIDRVTNDPLTIQGRVRTGTGHAEALYLPAAVSAPGAFGTQWTSDLTTVNLAGQPVSLTVEFIPEAGTAAGVLSHTVTLGPNEMLTLADVAASVFGVSNGKGTLRLTSPALDSVLACQRILTTTTGAGTYGQGYRAYSDGEALDSSAGTAIYLAGLERSAAFRTNVGVVNIGAEGAEVLITATAGATRSVQVSVAPGQLLQLNDLIRQVLGFWADVANVAVSVRLVGEHGRLLAYGSVVDNRSQDPTFVTGSRF